MANTEFEPYLHLAGLTHDAALITWGGFFFQVDDDDEWKVLDDSKLKKLAPPRFESVGAQSSPYGLGVVEVLKDGLLVASNSSKSTNYAWVSGLEPDTEYTYRVTVDGDPWAEGRRRDWSFADKRLEDRGRSYENRFRTNPAPDREAPVTFAVMGDFGVGVRKGPEAGRRQREVAAALDLAVTTRVGKHDEVRLLLTTGDNIYAARKFLGLPFGGQGDEDDDWFFTFFQPYRYVINRIPVYPSIGNHDTGETEDNDDRGQVMDNLYLRQRFAGEHAIGEASTDPGLFYRFRYGSSVEFVSIDTSKPSFFAERFLTHPKHVDFLDAAFPARDGNSKLWRIPFGHHPAYCAGPKHHNTGAVIDHLVPRFEQSGVRAYFSGHEHNYQHSIVDDVFYFVTGGGGKVTVDPPHRFTQAFTAAWAVGGHFLLVTIEGDTMKVTPVAELDGDGNPQALRLQDPNGREVRTPVEIKLG